MTKVQITPLTRLCLAADFLSFSKKLEDLYVQYDGIDAYESEYFVKASNALSILSASLLSHVNYKGILDNENGCPERGRDCSDDSLHSEHSAE